MNAQNSQKLQNTKDGERNEEGEALAKQFKKKNAFASASAAATTTTGTSLQCFACLCPVN